MTCMHVLYKEEVYFSDMVFLITILISIYLHTARNIKNLCYEYKKIRIAFLIFIFAIIFLLSIQLFNVWGLIGENNPYFNKVLDKKDIVILIMVIKVEEKIFERIDKFLEKKINDCDEREEGK